MFRDNLMKTHYQSKCCRKFHCFGKILPSCFSNTRNTLLRFRKELRCFYGCLLSCHELETSCKAGKNRRHQTRVTRCVFDTMACEVSLFCDGATDCLLHGLAPLQYMRIAQSRNWRKSRKRSQFNWEPCRKQVWSKADGIKSFRALIVNCILK